MVQQTGGSFGTAVLAVIAGAALAARPGDPAAGFHVALWWATAFSAVAVLLSLWLPGTPEKAPALAVPVGESPNLLPGGATRTGMVPDGGARPGLLEPDVMAAPIVWLASAEAATVHDQRLIATEFPDWLRAWQTR